MNAPELSQLLHGAPTRIHLIGVAGSGMSGIAALLLALGHQVSGSDRSETGEVQRLVRRGLKFFTPHHASQVRDAKLVIYSSAIRSGNPAFDEATRLCIPMGRRADALAALMSGKKGVVVCGMHGKTTTSAMAAYVLRASGLKPSHYVGAEIPILGSNARWDSEGELFVAEGDESDGTLVNYYPEHAIVLNIEPEHLDFYQDLAAIDAVYTRLIHQTTGLLFYCGDDEGAIRVCGSRPNAISYGTQSGVTYRLSDLTLKQYRPHFTVWRHKEILGEVHLGVPGEHNAVNSLAVIALATELGVEFPVIANALERFRGARRRFQIKYDDDYNVVVDDYGHHPTEIAATLATARSGGAKRIRVMFQPHRYSRTAALRQEFGACFSAADSVVVSEIYAASEKPLPGISGQTIVDSLIEQGHPQARFEPSLDRIHKVVGQQIDDGDLVISLGAGNIHESGSKLARDLGQRRKLLEVMGPGTIKLYEPLSRHTTMRIGGPAQFWAEPETEDGFAELVRFCFDEDIPFMVMGRGSNLLVRDGGIPGVVAHLIRGDFNRHRVLGDEIHAGVGVRFKHLSGIARNAGLAGFEWMEGIPGNLGGGLRMNAGAMGGQTFDQVMRVRFCDQDGNIFTKSPAEIEVKYRSVPMLAKNYALSATLKGNPAEIEKIDARIKESEQKRRSSQPVAASAGCIFKNPGPLGAGRLIDELGLKNRCIGKARVSEVHGNFIVNDGGASAKDVLTLIDEIRTTAEKERGIRLETEVQIVGED